MQPQKIIQKKEEKEERETKNKWDKQKLKKNKMVDLNSNINNYINCKQLP